ncbi:unnamed protein product [Calicophoron daubneyi]|uniref:Methyltransferase-like protein 22 n=1 Tax=Calicophoron daubneyi TaxID=300641 RepID=A0AAV2TET6_CALDB
MDPSSTLRGAHLFLSRNSARVESANRSGSNMLSAYSGCSMTAEYFEGRLPKRVESCTLPRDIILQNTQPVLNRDLPEPNEHVLSEVHLYSESTPTSISSKQFDTNSYRCFLSTLQFRVPLTELRGSCPIRTRTECENATPCPHDWEFRLPFFHSGPTQLTDVGGQLWNGSLLLIDWLIHEQVENRRLTSDDIVVDLGAGLGCTSVIAALCGAGVVFVTDRWSPTMPMGDLCSANLARWRVRFELPSDSLRMRSVDWFSNIFCQENSYTEKEPIPQTSKEYTGLDINWTNEDLELLGTIFSTQPTRRSRRLRLILAADAVYDISSTEALLRTVCGLLESNAKLGGNSEPVRAVFAIEQRICFTVDEMSTTSHAYDHFVSCLEQLDGYRPSVSDSSKFSTLFLLIRSRDEGLIF